MAQESIDLVRQMLDAFNRGDVGAVIASFDEDCELYEPGEMPDTPAGGFRGHAGIREWMTNLREVAGVLFEPTSFQASGEVILSEWAARGRGQASGAPIEWTTFAVLRVRDGKIVRAQAFLVRDEAIAAAGLGP
jgi:ketosteroid isomerase-like protein